MPSGGYESVSKDESPPPADDGAVRSAIAVFAISFAVSLCAFAFIAASLKFN